MGDGEGLAEVSERGDYGWIGGMGRCRHLEMKKKEGFLFYGKGRVA